ncbi:phage virion morphogenesis protein [Pectobacterium versatile]|uniref:phage virion morphogenesis protein n=1 Tax=Pectobacterium versatile TaxID=2488639 RepID=UPI002B240335|nr:phage virion morphogenesis protein [Pectobacterium versatile]
MNELKPFEDKLAALLESLTAPGRRQLAGKMAKALRAGQQQRIKKQQSPDGAQYEPRQPSPIRNKRERVKRQMFQKLRAAKYLKSKGTSDAASVEFIGRVQRIARVHQYGLRDKPTRFSPVVRYPARQLLGFSTEDIKKWTRY